MVNGYRVVRGRQRAEVSGPHPVVHRGLDQPRDCPEPDLARDEGGHCDLVGRIIDRGRTPARPQSVIGEPKRRKTIEITLSSWTYSTRKSALVDSNAAKLELE